MDTNDLTTVRTLVRFRRALGWTTQVYGDEGGHQHVYREGGISAVYGSKVVVEDRRIVYRRRGGDILPVREFILLRPEDATEVHGWLLALGLLKPTPEQVAAAILTPDALVDA